MSDVLERIKNRPASVCFERESCYLLDIAEAEIERLEAEKEQRRNRNDELLTRVGSLEAEIERLRTNLEIWKRNGGDVLQAAEIERLQTALDRYHYAFCFAAGEAWDGGIDMRARFAWARMMDAKIITDNDIANIGKMYLDWEGGK